MLESVQRFKAKARGLTVRKRDLDQQVIERLNRIVRETAVGFCRKFGLLTLEEFRTTRDLHGKARIVTPRRETGQP